VQGAIGECFGEVWPADGFRAVEVGNGTGDLEHAMIAAGGKMHRLGRLAQKLEACGVKRCNVIESLAVRLRIEPQTRLSERRETLGLYFSRGGNAGGDLAAPKAAAARDRTR
jgi:hypothetical protein